MLINLTNHLLLEKASNEALELFGGHIDLPPGDIDPNWTMGQVKMHVSKLFSQICNKYGDGEIQIMVNGEASYVIEVYRSCLNTQIPCYVYTNHRGQPENFIQFRRVQ